MQRRILPPAPETSHHTPTLLTRTALRAHDAGWRDHPDRQDESACDCPKRIDASTPADVLLATAGAEWLPCPGLGAKRGTRSAVFLTSRETITCRMALLANVDVS